MTSRDAALDTKLPWTARTATEKARARKLIAAGRVRIGATLHETYIGRRRLVNYEAWEIVPVDY